MENNDEEDRDVSPMWAVYLGQAERYDKALVATWREDTRGILLFNGLFAVVLSAFILEGSRSLTPDLTVLLLKQFNATTIPEPNTTTIVVSNALWLAGLGLSLTSALIASLVQQWARDFVDKSSDVRPTVVQRARIRSFLYLGIEKFRIHAIVDLAALLLHAALLLFLAGLAVFLYPRSRVLGLISIIISAIITLVYVAITFLPLLFADASGGTPLSRVFQHDTIAVLSQRATSNTTGLLERDKRALSWTVQSLTSDHDLEAFLATLPRALARRRHHPLIQHLIDHPGVHLASRIADLLLSSEGSTLDKSTKQPRVVTCLDTLLAFAMSTELGPNRTIDFPFEASTFNYLATTTYAPAQPYLPALRACGAWSLYCTFLTNLHRLMLLSDNEMHGGRPRIELLAARLEGVLADLRRYLVARGVKTSTSTELRELENVAIVLSSPEPPARINRTFRRIWDGKTTVQLEILCSFLLEAAEHKHPPNNFKEVAETVLRPSIAVRSHLLPRTLPAALRVIVGNAQGAKAITHLDQAIGILLHLCDTTLSSVGEQSVADSLITYINGRHSSEACLYILRNCDVVRVCARVSGRVSRPDNPDEVLTALWRLCRLFLDPRFSTQLDQLPLRSIVDLAAHLRLSSGPYSLSVSAMLRTVASHAAEAVHIPGASPALRTISPFRVAASIIELNYVTARLLSPSSSTPPDSTDVSAEADLHVITSQVLEARLRLFIEFVDACASASVPYKPAETLALLGASPMSGTTVVAIPTALQEAFATAFQRLADAEATRARENVSDDTLRSELLQIILECPLLAGLQWIDAPVAVATMRSALDAVFVSTQQLPVVVDAMNRLRVLEEANGGLDDEG
ncbi:Costars domain-containing protein [Mycena chlorophos]|uniref:Costars domain-containing protein n=1 Tax=Mycena chlorophos TaxID=658473 RepID=A0A8H6S256_MYCCL|nr:Costars domain-containing protein [Mycena chlorophos]